MYMKKTDGMGLVDGWAFSKYVHPFKRRHMLDSGPAHLSRNLKVSLPTLFFGRAGGKCVNMVDDIVVHEGARQKAMVSQGLIFGRTCVCVFQTESQTV